MSSANAYLLEVNGHTLKASWAAPYFALVVDHDPEEVPMLFHCETIGDAQSKGGRLLNHAFEDITDVPYPDYCLHPKECAGKTCCPRSLSCVD